MKRENTVSYILGKVHVCKWPVVKDKHIKVKPRIYVQFVFVLDGECKFTKNKKLQLLKKYVLSTDIDWMNTQKGGGQSHITLITIANVILK